jgi:hypothetical protein
VRAWISSPISDREVMFFALSPRTGQNETIKEEIYEKTNILPRKISGERFNVDFSIEISDF